MFAAANGFDKSLVINGGNLAVNGSLANATITVTTTGNMAGTLAGTGTVGSVSVSARGTVAPGFSLGGGTLTAGSLSLSPSSVLSYTLATSSVSSSNSRLSITGGLTLSTGLTLSINPASGSTWSSATSGTYVLATYGSLANNSSSFSGWTVVANPLLGRHTYGFSASSGSLDLSVGTGATVSGTWSGSGGGSWGTAGDWQGGNIPAYVGDTATFGTSIGSTAATVTLDGARGLSGLTLSTTGGGSYIVAGPGTLTFAGSDVAASLSNSGGQHTIAAPVALANNLAVSATTGSSLTVSGPISETSAGQERDPHRQRRVDPLRLQHVYGRHDGQRRHARLRRAGRRSEHGHCDGQCRRLRGVGGIAGRLVARDRSDHRDRGGHQRRQRGRCDDLIGKCGQRRGQRQWRGFARRHGLDCRGRSGGGRA